MKKLSMIEKITKKGYRDLTGDDIFQIRTELDMSADDFCFALMIKRTTLKGYESNHRKPAPYIIASVILLIENRMLLNDQRSTA